MNPRLRTRLPFLTLVAVFSLLAVVGEPTNTGGPWRKGKRTPFIIEYEHGWPFLIGYRIVDAKAQLVPQRIGPADSSFGLWGIPWLDSRAWPLSRMHDIRVLGMIANAAIVLALAWVLSRTIPRARRVSLRTLFAFITIAAACLVWNQAHLRRYRIERRVGQQSSFELYWRFRGPRGLSRLLGSANLPHLHHPFGVYVSSMPRSADITLLNELNLDELDVVWGASDEIVKFVKSLHIRRNESDDGVEIRRTLPIHSNFAGPLHLIKDG